MITNVILHINNIKVCLISVCHHNPLITLLALLTKKESGPQDQALSLSNQAVSSNWELYKLA